MPRSGERLAPTISALLLTLCYPPLHPLVLPFFALVPLTVWVATRPDGPAGRAAVRRGAALFAVVHFGLLFHWLALALTKLTPVGPALFLLGLGLVAVATVLWSEALHFTTVRLGAPVWLALPVSWTGLEWGLAHLPGTLAMPWLGLGTTLTGFPELVGIAEVVGARGVTFWLALVNGLAAAAVLAPVRSRSWRLGALALLTTLIPAAWGIRRAATLETWSVGRVAIVQPAVPQRLRLDPAFARDSTFAVLDRLVPRIPPGTVRLAILPEMVLPIQPGSGRDAAEAERLRGMAREVGAPVLFGARGDVDGSPRNSAFVVDTRGLRDFRYDKRRLVPVVERALYVPVGVPARFRPVGDFGPGEGWPLAEVEGVAFGATICFESAFADVARGLRRAGADVLVNLTNDAWFGAEPAETRTLALWQHPAHLAMRAIETRAGIVRVANAGFSLTVDPSGRMHPLGGPFDEGAWVVDVETSDVDTLFTRYGDLVGNACGAGLLVLLASAALSRRLDPPSAL